jgi:hypothetical protein
VADDEVLELVCELDEDDVIVLDVVVAMLDELLRLELTVDDLMVVLAKHEIPR